MRTLHASGHWQTSNADVRAWVAEQIAAHAPAYLTHTEAERHRSALTLHDGYGVVHPRGDEGQAECAIQYRLDGPALVDFNAVRLSSLPIPRRNGDFCYATYAEFADHHHLAIHLPSGVEGAFGFSDEHPAQVDCYQDAIDGLARFVAGLDGPCIIVGDFNIDPRLPWFHEYLRERFPGFTLTAVPASEGGTHKGGRLIDYSLVRGFTAAGDVIPNPTSDHRALLERITPTPKEPDVTATPKTDALVAALRRRGVEVLTHDQWGSQRRDVYRQRLTSRPHGLLPGKPVDTLWNHVTVTFDDGTLIGEFKADCREIERIGFDRFGSGVSYNILVDANADQPRVALGQFLEAKGTHTVNDKKVPGFSRDQNLVALAVAWVGMPGNKLNAHAITAMVQLRAALIEVGALTTHYDDVPHSLVAFKDCPTDELRNRLPELKRLGLAAVARPAVKLAPTRVTRARVLLKEAAKHSGPVRKAAILAGLALLPKR